MIGRATTTASKVPLGSEDPIEASRAVRRALADAGRRATDVDCFVVATPDPVGDAALRSFARRALGPPGEKVRVVALVGRGPADALADTAHRSLKIGAASWSTAIAVGFDADGATVALCICTASVSGA